MRIKRVILRGFKIFGDETIVGDFSPMSNCLFGMNGTGKSTFIQAIEFVLLEDFAHIRPTERQALLFSGPTSSSTAFVEIIFDNSDQSFPGFSDNLSVRRSIGLNKDEYFIDRKHISRAELHDLFETAGLSSQLFVVRQGRVKAVAEMNDESRLQLLYEVSGIDCYNEKREQSIKMMGEANLRREKIDQSLVEIKKRLAELEEETAELREYECCDRVRKALEYLVYEHERARIAEEISRNEELVESESSVVEEIRKDVSEQKSALKRLEEERTRTLKEKDDVMRTLSEAEAKRDLLIQKKVRSEYVIADLEKKLQESEQAREKIQAAINELIKERARKEQAIAEMVKRCDKIRSKKTQMEALLNDPNAVKECESEIASLSSQLRALEREVASEEGALLTLRCEDHELFQKNSELSAILTGISSDFVSMKERRKLLLDEQKQLWKREHELKMKHASASDRLRNAELKLSHLRTPPVSSALAFLKAQNYPLTFGTLLDLLENEAEFDFAIDAVAKSRLFHVVVETDRIAEDVIKLLQREHAGRLSLFGLNCVRPHTLAISKTANASPLIDELTFDERIRPVVESVFGGVAVCSTFEIAAQTAAAIGATCVTLSGDIVLASGPMVGGSDEATAARRSPSRAKRLVGRFSSDVATLEHELSLVAQELRQTEEELTKKSNEIANASSTVMSTELEIEKVTDKRAALLSRISEKERAVATLHKREDAALQAVRAAREREAALNGKAGEAFSPETYRAVCADFAAAMLEVESLRDALDGCTSELRRLEDRMRSVDPHALERRLASASEKLDHQLRRAELFEADLKDAVGRLTVLHATIEALEKNRDQAKEKLTTRERELANQQRSVGQYNNALLFQTAKRDELLNKIGAIGPYPAAEIEERRGLGYAELIRETQAVNRDLERFRFVNKRAFEQFKQFRDQREELERRQAEIAGSEAAIVALIRQLEQKKVESVCACFAKVSERFQAVYSEFNPEVRAMIVLKQHGEWATELDIEKVTGMGITVENYAIEALSGGQRTLIALALIFALQHSEPSPFYLLDEIDADLDIAHAGRVARFLQGIAGVDENPESWTQVIYTSHKNEMIAAAKKYFAVFPMGRGAGIREVGFDEVAKYLEEDRRPSDDE